MGAIPYRSGADRFAARRPISEGLESTHSLERFSPCDPEHTARPAGGALGRGRCAMILPCP